MEIEKVRERERERKKTLIWLAVVFVLISYLFGDQRNMPVSPSSRCTCKCVQCESVSECVSICGKTSQLLLLFEQTEVSISRMHAFVNCVFIICVCLCSFTVDAVENSLPHVCVRWCWWSFAGSQHHHWIERWMRQQYQRIVCGNIDPEY